MGYQTTLHASASGFFSAELPDSPACLLLDVRLPDASGLRIQEHLKRADVRLPVILMTGFGDIPMSVQGMKAGAIDFLTKPLRHQDLLDAVATALRLEQRRRQEAGQVAALRQRYARLTPREREVVGLIASGLTNKGAARKLSISDVTVKMHRASASKKLEAKSVAALVKMAEVLGIRVPEGSSP